MHSKNLQNKRILHDNHQRVVNINIIILIPSKILLVKDIILPQKNKEINYFI